MTAPATFRRELTTGSGSTQVRLELEEARARIEVRSRWVGQAERRYAVTCGARALSPATGVLTVESIEHGGATGALEALPIDGDDVLLPVVIEWVRVPRSPVHVHPQSQLHAMRSRGAAQWTCAFELLLLVDEEDKPAPGSPLEDLLSWLDKAKLEPVP